ncbi:GNAT family N-acetyltransferase [Thalassotalea sp. ND16A]|uniref:GNAT family N-acetyltransferase n=1 Tax=Thalassotalea sp. ND16A TaxID=1535422 RepID=UPI00051D0DF7|nr:GNAT family N-acetyltransferase [Thalassotalea sp. ND16A]KGJ89407.1 hypothetical protein ND16A_2300 [Thalassotalea sp. ND16A]
MQFESTHYAMKLLHQNDEEFFTSQYQDPATCLHTGGVFTLEQAQQRFHFCLKRNSVGTMLTFMIRSRIDNQALGFCALIWSKTLASVELGISLKSENIGKGIAKEVLPDLLNLAFNSIQIPLLMIRTDKNNLAMIKTIERFSCPIRQMSTAQINSDRKNPDDSNVVYSDADYYWYIENPKQLMVSEKITG